MRDPEPKTDYLRVFLNSFIDRNLEIDYDSFVLLEDLRNELRREWQTNGFRPPPPGIEFYVTIRYLCKRRPGTTIGFSEPNSLALAARGFRWKSGAS